MAREKQPRPDTSGDVPLWFVTYSDVITLMMTFFILLLTFATDEPESFEQMKVTFFGAMGALGIAGPPDVRIENDALTMRYRPDSSRVTTRGSENVPMKEDPHLTSMGKGLQGLDEALQHQIRTNYAVDVEIRMWMDRKGKLTNLGKQRLLMLARQLKRASHDVTFQVARSEDLPHAVTMGLYLADELQIAPGRVSLGIGDLPESESAKLRIILSRRKSSA